MPRLPTIVLLAGQRCEKEVVRRRRRCPSRPGSHAATNISGTRRTAGLLPPAMITSPPASACSMSFDRFVLASSIVNIDGPSSPSSLIGLQVRFRGTLSALMSMHNLGSSAFLGGALSRGTALINQCDEMVRPRL